MSITKYERLLDLRKARSQTANGTKRAEDLDFAIAMEENSLKWAAHPPPADVAKYLSISHSIRPAPGLTPE